MMKFYSYVVVLLFLCCFCDVSVTETQNHGFTVELIHPNSPKSPIYNIMESEFERVSKVMQHSMNRIHYLNHALFISRNKNMPESTITSFMGLGYTMSYSIGTPPIQLYGVIDTGSELIWFQCKPCKSCFNQTSPMFDPLKSSTYKTIPCSSPTCKYLEEKGNCSSNKKNNCEFNSVYDDKSNSHGDLSVETLTLNSNDRSPISFPRIVIGCAHENNLQIHGNVSGIIGLGRARLSLISQLGSSIGGKFSYCMVPYISKPHTSGKLYFGNRATVSGPGTVSTPLLQGFKGYYLDNFYITNLKAFSVGNEIIKLEQSIFGLFGLSKGNTVIDSGSTLTSLPKDVYSKLEYEVETTVKLKRYNDPTKQFSLCYKTPFEKLEVPIITAHFSGADVKLNAFNTFFQIDHEVWCFAFVTGAQFRGVIYGNVAQQNFLVGFDLQKNVVSFKPADCTKQ